MKARFGACSKGIFTLEASPVAQVSGGQDCGD
jgi:hypothetical protein